MNAVVKPALPVLDATGLAIAEAVLFAGSDVFDLVGSDASVLVASDLQQLNANADSAVDQATRLVVENSEQLGTAGDLLKVINAQLTTLDTKRKQRTKKIDDFKKSFMALFGAAGDKLAKAKTDTQAKMNEWGLKEQQRIRDEQAAAQKVAEDRALALAAAQQAMGDSKGADQVMEEAAQVINSAPAEKLVVRGSWGSSTSSRKVYSGQVADVRKFLTWLLAQEKGDIANVVDFKQSGLNAIAKSFEGKEVPGFQNNTRDTFGAR